MSTLDISREGRCFVLSGELDMGSAPKLAAAFGEVLPADGPLTVDVRRLEFMDSSGIQAIIAACRAAGDTCIVLHGVRDQVQKVLEITRVDLLLNLHVVPCAVGVSPDMGLLGGLSADTETPAVAEPPTV